MLIQKSDEHKERIMMELSSNKESIKVNSHILRKCGTSRQTDNQYAGIIVELKANKYPIHFMRNLKGMVACFIFTEIQDTVAIDHIGFTLENSKSQCAYRTANSRFMISSFSKMISLF